MKKVVELQQAVNDVYEMLADTSIYSSTDTLKEHIEQAMHILEVVYSGDK